MKTAMNLANKDIAVDVFGNEEFAIDNFENEDFDRIHRMKIFQSTYLPMKIAIDFSE